MSAAFERCAHLIIPRVMKEFGLKDWQACAIVGNLAAESGGFTQLQELNPLISGSRGGYGWAQWTGERRVAYENWCRDKSLNPASDDANLGFLVEELHTTHRRAITRLKTARTFEDAVIAFEQAYEGADARYKHYDKRNAWATKAIHMWRGEHLTAPPPVETKEVPVPIPVAPANPPTLPFYKSPVFLGAVTAFVGSAVAAFQIYKPGVPLSQQSDFLSALLGAVGSAVSAVTRTTATAQPLTLTS